MDYRFFPEPDLPPLVITNDRIEALKTKLSDVELPDETLWRLQDQYGLPETVARWFVCAHHDALGTFALRLLRLELQKRIMLFVYGQLFSGRKISRGRRAGRGYLISSRERQE